jgi:hypothetical protein
MQLKDDYTTISLLVSGFQDKGANWKDQQLYYFSIPTGIRYQGDAALYRVVYPDGTLSADYYNLARTKQHCRDLARAIYPRQPPAPSARSDGDVAGASDCDVAGAPGNAAHSSKSGPPSRGCPSNRKRRVRHAKRPSQACRQIAASAKASMRRQYCQRNADLNDTIARIAVVVIAVV